MGLSSPFNEILQSEEQRAKPILFAISVNISQWLCFCFSCYVFFWLDGNIFTVALRATFAR